MSSSRNRRAVRTGLSALLCVVAILVGSCSWTDETTRSATYGLPDTEQRITAEEWLLDPGDSSLTAMVDQAITLRFGADGLLSGAGACNSYRGPFEVDDGRLRVGPLATTRMACPGDREAADTEYLAALERVRDVDTTDRHRLVLTDADVRLAFTARED